MKTRSTFPAGAMLLAFATGCGRVALLVPALVFGATPKSDIVPPQRRQISVDAAERLAQRKGPEPLAAELASPFAPADFDKPDPSAAPAPTAGGPRPAPSTGGPAPAPVVTGDRETLETLAGQITPSGMITLGGRPRLIIKGKPFEIGTRFTVTYKDQDYELELVAIDRTTFTLRYRNEETTRPIRPVR